jgi:hypothetical protein
MIKIEKKIPIPSRRQGRNNLYPFASMKVGDSFEVKVNDRTSLGNAARQWAAREKNGFKFTTSAMGDKIRIWRIA